MNNLIDTFSQPPNKRSKTVILVKNLPAATPAQEILQLFARHGELGRFVMPPSGITGMVFINTIMCIITNDKLSCNVCLALVEFLEPSEARKAFSQLAYTKYKHLPLYLEWAPDNSFTTPPPAGKNKATEVGANEKNNIKEVVKQAEEFSESINDTNKANKEESEDEDEPEQETTLFVKNINFTTTEEQLKTVNNLILHFFYYSMDNVLFCSILANAVLFIMSQ